VKVCVAGGAGYVGLVTGLGLAELGHRVVNVDVDQRRVDMLRQGRSPIHEAGIDAMLARNLAAGRIAFTADLHPAATEADCIFIAVGTPSRPDGQADLSQVIQVTESLAKPHAGYQVIVIKSTVPVGTAELMLNILKRQRDEGVDFDLVANPEFLREGQALYDFFYPDRVVIGSSSPRATGLVRDLYGDVMTGTGHWNVGAPTPAPRAVPVVETDLASAQMIKHAANAFLATRISFINEIAGICERVGADVGQVVRGIGYDKRIGHGYLSPGLGFGGPCLEKDLRALMRVATGNGFNPEVLSAVLARNDRQIESVIAKLKRQTGYLLYRKRIAVWGLAFKAGTNDVRSSLALRVVARLLEEGASVQAHDPVAMPEARAIYPDVTYRDDPYEACERADALLILTEWPQFKEPDLARLKALLAAPRIVDARNLLDTAKARAAGFDYTGVGRL